MSYENEEDDFDLVLEINGILDGRPLVVVASVLGHSIRDLALMNEWDFEDLREYFLAIWRSMEEYHQEKRGKHE